MAFSEVADLGQEDPRADYGKQVMERLAQDLTARLGRGFSRPNLTRSRLFYLAYPPERIRSTLLKKSGSKIRLTPPNRSTL